MDEKEAEASPLMGTIFLVIIIGVYCNFNIYIRYICKYGHEADNQF